MVNMHYCMGKLAGTSLVNNATAKCGKCGMDKSTKKGKSCCHDSKKLVKNVVDQNVANKLFSIDHPLFFIATIRNCELISFALSTGAELSNYSHAPPGQPAVPLYITDCSFLI